MHKKRLLSVFTATAALLSAVITGHAAPVNDDIANATSIPSASFITVFGDNSGATYEVGETPTGGINGTDSVWWTYTAPNDGNLTVDTFGSGCSDTELTIYSVGIGGLVSIINNDDFAGINPNYFDSRATFPVTQNLTYYIRVKSHSTTATQGSINLTLALNYPVPPNDNFANATGLTGFPAAAIGTNINATYETAEPISSVKTSSTNKFRGIWWSWVAPASQTVRVSTLGSYVTNNGSSGQLDTVLDTFELNGAASFANLTDLGHNDDDKTGSSSTASALNIPVTAGKTYYFRVGGYNAKSGLINIAVTPTNIPAYLGDFNRDQGPDLFVPGKLGATTLVNFGANLGYQGFSTFAPPAPGYAYVAGSTINGSGFTAVFKKGVSTYVVKYKQTGLKSSTAYQVTGPFNLPKGAGAIRSIAVIKSSQGDIVTAVGTKLNYVPYPYTNVLAFTNIGTKFPGTLVGTYYARSYTHFAFRKGLGPLVALANKKDGTNSPTLKPLQPTGSKVLAMAANVPVSIKGKTVFLANQGIFTNGVTTSKLLITKVAGPK